MKLFYCLICNIVAAFDERQITKHGLMPVEHRKCPVCSGTSYTPVEVED